MVLPPLYAIRSHPFRNLRHPNAAHTNSAVCMADLYLHLKSACCGTSVKRCILKSSRVVVVTPMAQVLPIWFALSLSLFSPSPSLFALFLQNSTPRLIHPGPFMGQLVDLAYVTPRYCTGLQIHPIGERAIMSVIFGITSRVAMLNLDCTAAFQPFKEKGNKVERFVNVG